jgi:hypothetical protein
MWRVTFINVGRKATDKDFSAEPLSVVSAVDALVAVLAARGRPRRRREEPGRTGRVKDGTAAASATATGRIVTTAAASEIFPGTS